jgi:hypothetical protein
VVDSLDESAVFFVFLCARSWQAGGRPCNVFSRF